MVKLARVVWGGTIFNAVSGGSAIEIWSCSLSLMVSDTVEGASLSSMNESIAAYVKTFHQSANTGISSRVAIEYVRTNIYDVVSGIQITDPTQGITYASSNRGGNSATNYPTFIALKVSLDNGTRNRRAKGGFYIPVFSLGTQPDGRMSAAVRDPVATQAKVMIDAINALVDVLGVVVWSRTGNEMHGVTRLRVGDTLDVVTRRKNAMRENYKIETIVP